jgi:hypothetical protein
MKAQVYRPNQLGAHGSWQPRSLVDMRGPVFPDQYHALVVVDATEIAHVFDQYPSSVVFPQCCTRCVTSKGAKGWRLGAETSALAEAH